MTGKRLLSCQGSTIFRRSISLQKRSPMHQAVEKNVKEWTAKTKIWVVINMPKTMRSFKIKMAKIEEDKRLGKLKKEKCCDMIWLSPIQIEMLSKLAQFLSRLIVHFSPTHLKCWLLTNSKIYNWQILSVLE